MKEMNRGVGMGVGTVDRAVRVSLLELRSE